MFSLGCAIDDVDCIVDMPAADIQLAFSELYSTPPCREGEPIAPAVDGKILQGMLSTMHTADTVRRVPLIVGWNVHDGNYFIDADVELDGEDMDSDTYDLFWSHFRGAGFEQERTDAGFDESAYEAYGFASAAYMAAESVVTTAMYSCGVHALVTPESVDEENMFVYVFDATNGEEVFCNHGDELNYILTEPGMEDNGAIATNLRTYWTNFAKYKDPNGEDASDPLWTPTTTEDFTILRIQAEPAMEEWIQPERCEYWEALDNGQWFGSCNDVWWEDSVNKDCDDECDC